MSKQEAPSAAATEPHVASLYDDDDDDDEADFDPGDDSDDDSSDESSDDEEERDCVILDGKLHLNEEGRLVYHGTWCMKSEYRPGGVGAKFKLKSQEVFGSISAVENSETGNSEENGEGAASKTSERLLFDFRRPTLSHLDGKKNGSAPLPSRRTFLLDGFFLEKSSPSPPGDRKKTVGTTAASPVGNGEHKSLPQGKRMKERDVELFFQLHDASDNHNREQPPAHDDSVSASYTVTGRGYNAYGPFVLEGVYTPGPPGTQEPVLVLRKTYGSGGNAKDTNVFRGSKRRRKAEGESGNAKDANVKKRRRKVESEEEDDEDWAEEKTDYMELIELTEDANLSVEELRRKYYGGGGGGVEEGEDGGGGKLPANKAKFEESDDSECGF